MNAEVPAPVRLAVGGVGPVALNHLKERCPPAPFFNSPFAESLTSSFFHFVSFSSLPFPALSLSVKDHIHTLFCYFLGIGVTCITNNYYCYYYYYIIIIIIIYLFAVADFEKIFKEIVSIDSPVVGGERKKKIG